MPDINGKTLLVGLLATPIRHSNSPRMQSEAFAMTGVNCVQLAFEVGNEQLEDAVKGLRALGAVGFNVSMPNKRRSLSTSTSFPPPPRSAARSTPSSTTTAGS